MLFIANLWDSKQMIKGLNQMIIILFPINPTVVYNYTSETLGQYTGHVITRIIIIIIYQSKQRCLIMSPNHYKFNVIIVFDNMLSSFAFLKFII